MGAEGAEGAEGVEKLKSDRPNHYVTRAIALEC
jgi:hypothetical protein